MASENETLEEDNKHEDVANVQEDKMKEEDEDEAEQNQKEVDNEEEEKEEEASEKVDKEEEVSEEKTPRKSELESKEVETSKKSKKVRKKSEPKKAAAKEPKKTNGESTSKDPPITPIERPTRERKTVERYSETSPERGSAVKSLSIEKGKGTQLKDIPNVTFKLSKRKPDDNLQLLHVILFGKRTKPHTLKKNISLFSGFVWVDNKEKQRTRVKEKIDKCVKEKLLDFCDILDIPILKGSAKKEDLSAKILEFLESPHATTEILLADKAVKGKKRKGKAISRKSQSSIEAASETPAKKQKLNSQSGEKRKHSFKSVEEDEVDDKVGKDDSPEDDNSDAVSKEESMSEEEIEEVEPKKPAPSVKSSSKKIVKKDSGDKSKSVKNASPAKSAKTTPKSTKKSSTSAMKKNVDEAYTSGIFDSTSKSKVSATKKQRIEKEREKDQSSSAKEKTCSKKPSFKPSTKVLAKDQGKGKASKKTKPEPSKEEMHAVVVDILKEVDFNTATLLDILRQLGDHFDVDLMHRKAEVKSVITDVISNMTDDDDEGEEEETGEDGAGEGEDGAGDGEDDNDA